MNNDLISRSALKKAIETYDKFACLSNGKLEPFRNLEHPEIFEPYVHLRDILNAIDNAPTVELTETEIQEVLNKRCMTAVANEYLIALHIKIDNAYSLGFKEGAEYGLQLLKIELTKRGYINEKTDKGENTETAEK